MDTEKLFNGNNNALKPHSKANGSRHVNFQIREKKKIGSPLCQILLVPPSANPGYALVDNIKCTGLSVTKQGLRCVLLYIYLSYVSQ